MAAMSDFEQAADRFNDPTQWGTPKKGRKSEKRQRSAVVSVRMTDSELATVQQKAQAVGQTIGSYMREVALGTYVAPTVGARYWLPPRTLEVGAPHTDVKVESIKTSHYLPGDLAAV